MTKAQLKKSMEPALQKLRIVQQLKQEEMRLNHVIDRLNDNLANLNHQIVGYKALISYLEFQLGLKGSQ